MIKVYFKSQKGATIVANEIRDNVAGTIKIFAPVSSKRPTLLE